MSLRSLFTRRPAGRAGDISEAALKEAAHKAKCEAIDRDLDDRLAQRKAARTGRSCASVKGWITRRAGR